MASITVIEGDCGDNAGRSFALVAARWNGAVVEHLKQGAVDALLRNGVSAAQITVIQVPGAFELPLAARAAAHSGRYAAIIALGAVVRGDTPHFDYVAGECLGGLARIMEECDVPVTCGVLTVDTLEQANVRSSLPASEPSPAQKRRENGRAKPPPQNRGEEAALAALEMASLLSRLPAKPVK